MEAIVVIAIVLILIVIAFPVYSWFRTRQHKQTAVENMKLLGSVLTSYANQNAGLLPSEDAEGQDTWSVVASPAAKDAWYNALPKLAGRKGAGEFSPEAFYTGENILFLPGANYPDKKKFLEPQFAIAYNTKLQRKDPDGKKVRVRLADVTNAARTVALLEQGLLNEDRTLSVQTKADYDGSPKGSAKSFVGRYGGEGVICFMDGHVEVVKAADLLTATGLFPFPQGNVVWTTTAEENPNKDSSAGSSKKKK